MDIKLYNTLGRRKQKFVPIDPKNVRMYVCGPTVYDYAHIGNARPVIVFDVLFRLFRHVYGAQHVTFVRNITDVDDKINARANQEGISIQKLTEQTLRQFQEDVSALGALLPNKEPRATDHIGDMLLMMEALVEKGHAYAAEGHVLFHVPSMQKYGELSKRSTDDMLAGARVEVAPYKRDPMDFVLWKPSREGEPHWDSKWGCGRPGWHIECSAMAKKYLGDIFDIHGGGIDLAFPHHENELAQSCCAHGTDKLANFWMHNGFLQVEGEKMAKSQGNFITIHELLKEWPGEVIRLALLSTHYRQPIDFTHRRLREAKGILDGWYNIIEDTVFGGEIDESFISALANDLNTPSAVTVMHQLKSKAAAGDEQAVQKLKTSGRLLGLLQQSAVEWFAWRPSGYSVDKSEVELLIAERAAARNARDFQTSDEIRNKLAGMGIVLSDSKNPQTGEIETKWQYK